MSKSTRSKQHPPKVVKESQAPYTTKKGFESVLKKVFRRLPTEESDSAEKQTSEFHHPDDST
mgnify:FL=1